ncbi:GNAT family N-acetyltransferase [uncultured Georgenia sp.]|uniref:GNAT family N-acetyltransferase n=1 Tax=uncultured Georgenia sp. TaxID=378209 RepID=UPI002621F975|nr:GNAT family N-acetyltransferase [uncultured Georgenia sp.]HLV05531.1 GNAT family N-acetyltransferase [Actinomycetaceae bacterium]
MEPFPLHDGDLVLSVPTSADVDRITELCQDPEVQRWTTVPSPYTRAHAESFVADLVGPGWRHGSPTWALRVGDRLVGMVGLAERDHPGYVEIGYWLGAEARGAGLMSRAVGLVLDAAFGRLGAERVEWRADVGNWPSWRVAWRHGFRREGTLRRVARKRGERVDQWVGSLLRDDPREPASPWDGPRPDSAAVLADPTGRDPEALVRQFHDHFGVPVAQDAPSVARERVGLRMELVAEEFAELMAAVYGEAAAQEVGAAYARAARADDGTRDTVAAADALADLVYVLYGMAQECGIPLPAVLAEVHAANLSKLGEDGRPVLREDGKVLRAPGYRPPDVAGVLTRHTR